MHESELAVTTVEGPGHRLAPVPSAGPGADVAAAGRTSGPTIITRTGKPMAPPEIYRTFPSRLGAARGAVSARERIDVPAGSVVPGPAEIEALPERSALPAAAAELAAELDFVLLPVRDDQIRQIRPARYLVPESLRDGPRWPQLLHELLAPHA